VTARHGIFGDCYGFVNVPQLSQEKWPDIAETAILGFHLNFGYETGVHNTDYYGQITQKITNWQLSYV
jgi:hypothetical protein